MICVLLYFAVGYNYLWYRIYSTVYMYSLCVSLITLEITSWRARSVELDGAMASEFNLLAGCTADALIPWDIVVSACCA